MAEQLLSMQGIDKSFAGVKVLHAASLQVDPGEVHALIGQNGAGKSTMIKILTGVYKRDAGQIDFDHRRLDIGNPRQAQDAGISTIYQELTLVPLRSVTENVTLGYEPRKFSRFGIDVIDWKSAHARTREILTRFGIEIDVRAPLGSYSTAIQQLVAIARAVSLDAKLVIMDEPTSSLDDREVEVLFNVIRGLKQSGVSVLYVSHFLDELFRVCDAVTVMRDGRTVARKQITQTSKIELIADMLGRDIAEIESQGMTELGGDHRVTGDVLLDARDVGTGRRLQKLDLTIHRGEIVGLAGLLGSGRTETAQAIFGVDPLTKGEIRINGATATQSPATAIAGGIGYLTEDRKAEGIIPEMSVRENITLAILPRLAKGWQVSRGRERDMVDGFIKSLGIKTASMDQPIRELSGGNQQKALLARWLATEPDLLLLDEPTRGVDVGAKLEIQTIISDFVAAGHAVLLISSEFEELVEGADRIVVMQDGRSLTVLENPGVTEDALVAAIAHHEAGAVS